MLIKELASLFECDKSSPESNDIGQDLLANLDEFIFRADTLSDEVLSVYKKFVPMKQDAPEKMKNELFSTIRNFAKELFVQEKYTDAIVLYRFLTVKSVLLPEDYYSLAEALYKLFAIGLSEKFIELYKSKEQNKPLLFITLANFYNLTVKDYKKAISYYEKYLEIDKTKSVVYTITANLYTKVYGYNGLKESLAYYEKAYELKPNDRLSLHSLAFGWEKLGDKNKAKKFYEELLKNNPTNTDYYNYGAFSISCGDFINGHKYFRYRFEIDDVNNKYPLPLSKKWDFKTNIKDKTLLVHYEQGFGDTLMYCRFVPLLKEYASKIILIVQDDLFELIKNSPIISDGVEIISDKDDRYPDILSDNENSHSIPKIEYDYSMGLLDAPYVLNTTIENIPFTDGYLDVDSSLIEKYRMENFPTDCNIKIGIAYSGDKNANYSNRDVDISKFEALTDMSGISFYSFQYGEESNHTKIKSLGNTFNNFSVTAAALKNMDLVISTDNVILNLAGALGVKTLALFNKQTNYRWYKFDTEDCGWYNSVKPLQNDIQDDWSNVFKYVINILSKLSK